MDQDQGSQLFGESLAYTPYACMNFERLSGGYTNSTYRGTLAQPLEDGTSTVVIKKAQSIVTPEFSYHARRSFYEYTLLSSPLPTISHALTPTQTLLLRTPKPHTYLPTTHIQIIEDLPRSSDLKTYLSQHPISPPLAHHLGAALGAWTAKFHAWGRLPERESLRKILRENTQAKKLKWDVNYGRLASTAEKFPMVLGKGAEEGWWREVGERMRRVAERGTDVIHGDFWAGNILLPSAAFSDTQPQEASPSSNTHTTTAPPHVPSLYPILILDWELAHLSSIVFDLGQMLAELYLLLHFRAAASIPLITDAFLASYGPLPKEDALDVMIHCGVHLMVWPWRVRGWEEGWEEKMRMGKGEGGRTRMEECVGFGAELVRRAVGGEEGLFRGLFADEAGGSA